MEGTDETLLKRTIDGDGDAFVQLVRRYERPLASLIRHRVGNLDDAQDVLQETLLQAWVGLPRLRDPGRVRAWLMQIAHNRCRDFLKSPEGRQIAASEDELAEHLNRSGHALAHERKLSNEIIASLEAIAEPERDAARLFYLEGFSIAEIAARSQTPVGTVKRRLYTARECLRQMFGVTKEARPSMRTEKRLEKAQPFPERRPELHITPDSGELFAVNCLELRWWSIVPEVGNVAMWAHYDPPNGRLTEVAEMRVVRPAQIHKIDCVEVEVSKWEPGNGWGPYGLTIYGRLTEDKAQYLAVAYDQGDSVSLSTFLDEGFDWNWGEMDRRIEDRGRFVTNPDGSFTQAHSQGEVNADGAGVFQVRVGERTFRCLRVFGVEGPVDDPSTAVTESYVTEAGRTVWIRHYAPEGRDNIVTDADTSLVIDGQRFLHWYDTMTDAALGRRAAR
jgi:RNA polymerase sigma-70 factor (ECF subfamily)